MEVDMGKINWGRVFLGGLIAGVIVNLSEFLVNGVMLMEEWAKAMQALGRPAGQSAGQMAAFIVFGFLVGLSAVWLYAAIRPRYGAGPKTAVCAGAAVWFLAYFLSAMTALPMDLFPARLLYIGVGVGLAEVLIGTLLGACVYKEEATGTQTSAPAAGA
jgi:magnesium-transporting ATPase (P-type)